MIQLTLANSDHSTLNQSMSRYSWLIASFCLFTLITSKSHAMLFDSHTMRDYCEQYIQLVELQDDVDHYQAGLCMGYISSKVELMSYTEQLCDRDKLNIENIITSYVEQINSASQASSAIQGVVGVLEQEHGCE
jgi:hypothetical protein